jgi:hypothetical protein
MKVAQAWPMTALRPINPRFDRRAHIVMIVTVLRRCLFARDQRGNPMNLLC